MPERHLDREGVTGSNSVRPARVPREAGIAEAVEVGYLVGGTGALVIGVDAFTRWQA